MSVIVELSLPATEFQLGRILSIEGDTAITLETLVPLGDRSVPFFRIHGRPEGDFEQQVNAHPSVSDLRVVNSHMNEILYAVDWEIADESFLQTILALDGHVLDATGDADEWVFQLRFPTHARLSAFQETCFDSNLPLDIKRIYNPTKPDAGPWYGLTTPQREALSYAVEMGYYSLPRGISTQKIAEEFDVSDQAVTERLRRAIETLVMNTLLLSPESEDGGQSTERER